MIELQWLWECNDYESDDVNKMNQMKWIMYHEFLYLNFLLEMNPNQSKTWVDKVESNFDIVPTPFRSMEISNMILFIIKRLNNMLKQIE